jgi:peptide/nickel transport system substrate-binding protein
MRHRVRPVVLLCAAAGMMALAACGAKTNDSSSSSSTTAAKGGQKGGGSLTVLLNSGYEGTWPAGLDPATNTNGAANQSLMNSIYGQLIELHEGGKLEPGLASAFKF